MPWGTNGGDFAPAISASTTVGAPGLFYSWSSPAMIADVQAWLDSPADNHGWILRGDEGSQSTARRFESRTADFDGFWPTLSLTWLGGSVALGAVPDGAGVPGQQLMVSKAILGQVRLTWGESCLASDENYAVFEGSLDTLGGHVFRTCTTGGNRFRQLSPMQVRAYYLVVPVDSSASAEGSHGRNHLGVERAQGATQCFPQAIDDPVCP